MRMSRSALAISVCLHSTILTSLWGPAAKALGPIDGAITFQGQLKQSGSPANGVFDFEFALFDAFESGAQVGSVVAVNSVSVSSGLFTVELTFDDGTFDGTALWLEIAVRSSGSINPYTTLAPRQAVTATPYALLAENANTIDGLMASDILTTNGGSIIGALDIESDLQDREALNVLSLNSPLVGTFESTEINGAIIRIDANTPGGRTYRLYSTANAHSRGAGKFFIYDEDADEYRFTINSSGNTGIGTTAPAYPFHVFTQTTSNVATFESTNPNGSVLKLDANSSGGRAFRLYSTADAHSRGAGKFFIYDEDADAFRFSIDSSGNTGIGTATPNYPIHVFTTTTPNVATFESTDLNGSTIRLDANSSGGRTYRLYSTANFHSEGAGKFFIYDEDADGYRLAITENGNVGIGTVDPEYLLHVNGNAAKPGGGSWTSASDRRLKDLYGDFRRGLDVIDQLRPVYYRYSAGNPLALPDQELHVGLVAQDVARVIPEAVSEAPDGFFYLNNDPVLWTMLNAIRELRAENQSLKDLICLDHADAEICK